MPRPRRSLASGVRGVRHARLPYAVASRPSVHPLRGGWVERVRCEWAFSERVGVDGQADFEAFVRARWPVLLRTAYLLTADAHLAEDLLQDTLVKVASRWEAITRGGPPEAYVRRALVTQSIDGWRRRGRQPQPAPDVILAQAIPSAGPIDVSDRVDVGAALAQLTARQRAYVVLRYVDDLTEVETARLLGVSVGTVKSQSRDALARLRTLLTPSDSGVPAGRTTTETKPFPGGP